tara:strand:- start:414 stop:515 length:102 start_codon:yes stop_codon:yes gene_type:complete
MSQRVDQDFVAENFYFHNKRFFGVTFFAKKVTE